MTLEDYQRKRRFDQTPEPRGEAAAPGGRRFVVHRHRARRQHDDLRLEAGGVFKSWAVPKGVPLAPGERRLAVMVEDHPLEYGEFEGIIPSGNYGAGTVILWDRGQYESSAEAADSEAALLDGLAAGKASFVLAGSKLRGTFTLVRLKRGGDNDWLLLRNKDDGGEADLPADDVSAASGRSFDEIEAQAEARGEVWLPGNAGSAAAAHQRPAAAMPDLSDLPRAPMPREVKPMLAGLAQAAFDDDDWLFEIKWDGYRAIAEVADGQVRLYSRNNLDLTERFAPVARALGALAPHEAVIDGEIVLLDESGHPDFQRLQNYQGTAAGQLAYYAFDLLYLDGHDLTAAPLSRRKAILEAALPLGEVLRYSAHVGGNGPAFLEAAVAQDWEGIMAKQAGSPYVPGKRTRAWLKIKVGQRAEAVIAGFTAPRGGRKHLGALVLGVHRDGELQFVGHAGTGFDAQALASIRRQLEPLVQAESPFRRPPPTNSPVTWVRPELVAEVRFSEWTRDGRMRHPVFAGLRSEAAEEASGRHPGRRKFPGVRRAPGTELAVGGRTLSVTNLGKRLWPEDGYAKRDLISYYRRMAPIMLAYLRDRPQNLHRQPNGIGDRGFWQKNMDPAWLPDWIPTVEVTSEGDGSINHHMVCQEEATLAYMANLGCIEINPWLSRAGSLEMPDYAVLDLDPQGVPFEAVRETALVIHDMLQKAAVPHWLKTSGSRGAHIYIPTGARYSYDQARMFAELVAALAHQRLPKLTSLERQPDRRVGQVYIDFLQNRRGQTLASVYSLRPRPGATVSTPLSWRELETGAVPGDFHIGNIFERIERLGDLWAPMANHALDLQTAVEALRQPPE
jgi:bifunctional non-homologous end joining protein LigD